MVRHIQPDQRPVPRILEALATSSLPLNKYQIQKSCKVGRQTLYNEISRFKRLGWITITATAKSRVGLPVEFYTLTDLGLYRAGDLNPHLHDEVRTRLGGKFEQFETTVHRNRLMHLQEHFRLFQNAIEREKAPPNWYMRLQINADAAGRVRGYAVSYGDSTVAKLRRSK